MTRMIRGDLKRSLLGLSLAFGLAPACDDGDGDDSGGDGAETGSETSGDGPSSTDGTGEGGDTTMSAGDTAAEGGETGASEEAITAFETWCITCHGSEGGGMMGLGPDIQHPVEDYAKWVVRNGRTAGEHGDYPGSAMIAYPEATISEDLLDGIIAYLDSPPQPTTGEGLFLDYCAHCHGASGEGPAPMNRPLAEVANADDFIANVRAGHHPGEYDNREEFMPSWTADELSDAEITMMAEYVAGL